MQSDRRSHVWYFVQEAVLIIVTSYLLFFGGTFNGLVVPQIISVTLWLVGGASLTWVGWCVFRRRWIETPPLWLPVLVMVLVYVLTGLTSMDPRRSLNAIWVFVLEVWIFLLVYDLVKQGWPAELFVKVLLLMGAIVVAFVLWQLLDWERRWLVIGGWEAPIPPIWLRPASFYSHANLVASFVNLLWPLALVWLWNTRSRLTRLWCSLLIAGCGTVMVFSSSRGALLAAAGALALMTLLALGWQRQSLARFKALLPRLRCWQIFLIVVVVVAVGSGLIVLLARLLAHPTHGSFWHSRTAFWQTALDAFRRSPFVGSGPDTYASDYLRRQSVPPQPLYLRAHSMPMQLAAETGLIGLIVSMWLVLALIVAAYRRWRAAQPGRRYLIAGLCGALTTAGLHSLVDAPVSLPAVTLTLMMLVALLFSESPRQSVRLIRQRLAGTIMAVSTALLLVGAGAWMQRAYDPYYHGAVLGNMSAWTEALPWLEEATRRDPGHAYYRLQAGFAYGMSAFEGNPAHLSQAIDHYQRGISREPYYSLNHANLAVLLWQQGERQAAIAAMQRAAELAPAEAAYPLNLGVFCEEQGEAVRATELYQRALTLRPGWAEAYFWRASDIRRAALQSWQAAQPALAFSPVLGAEQTDEAEESLAQFDQAVHDNPANSAAHLGRAVALIVLERWDEAERALRVAEFTAQGGGSATSSSTHNDIAYYQAVVAYQRGRPLEAIQALEQVLGQVRGQSLFGPGGEGAALYGWGVFYRVGWGRDALPGLQVIRFTDLQVNRLLLLGRWYESAGDTASACRIYKEALEVAPDTTLAMERLEVIESRSETD